MKGLDGLVRLYRWRLDEKRRALAALESLATDLRRREVDLAAALTAEQEKARQSDEARFAYGAFAATMLERRRNLEVSRQRLNEEMVDAREAVTDAYRELKRYEIARAQRDEQESRRRRHEEHLTLDEIGAVRHRRRANGLSA